MNVENVRPNTLWMDLNQISTIHLKHFVDYAVIKGINPELIQESINQLPVDLENVTGSVSPDDFYQVLGTIDKQLDDELLGLRVGNFLSLKALGLVYEISLQTTSLQEALFYLQDYLVNTFPIINLDTVISNDFTTIQFQIHRGEKNINRLVLENIITVIRREIEMMCGMKNQVQAYSPHVNTMYPTCWKYHSDYKIRFNSNILNSDIADKSRFHLDILIPEYLRIIESIKPNRTFLNIVKTVMLSLASPQLPVLTPVANTLHLTPRTLQRKLLEEITSFSRTSAELKQTISRKLIMNKNLKITDIAYMNGYSDPSSFSRSFKNHHGMSPLHFRKIQFKA